MTDADTVLAAYPAGRALLKQLKEQSTGEAQAIKVMIVKLLSEANGAVRSGAAARRSRDAPSWMPLNRPAHARAAATNGAGEALATRINTDDADIIVKGISLLNPRRVNMDVDGSAQLPA